MTQLLSPERIYTEYKDKVAGYVYNHINNYSEADDLVSDIFLKVYENLDRFDPSKASLSTWIYTITSRTVTDYYRTSRTYTEIPSENGEEGIMPDALVDSRGLDEDMLQEEQLDSLADALEQLSERERDLIILHYYKGLTLKEVADRMNMSYANVKIIHKKALDRMRGVMEQ